MFGAFFEQNVFVYVITAIGICGIMARLIMNFFLGGLVRDVDKMETTRKKSLVEIRKRYEGFSFLKTDIRDTKAFAERYIYRLKIGKISISALDGFCRNMRLLSVGTGLIGAWWLYRSGSSGFEAIELFGFGIVACGLMQVVNNIFSCEQKRLILTAELQSYLNNGLANKVKREAEKRKNEKQESFEKESATQEGAALAAASVIEKNVIDIDEALGLKPEKEISQAQIDACDALFDNLLKGISTT